MGKDNLQQVLIDKFGFERVLRDEPLRKHTTWRVGGPADLFVEVRSEEELVFAVQKARANGVEYFILGGGANILVGDKGYRGLVVKNMVETLQEIPVIEDWEDHSTGTYRHAAVHFHYYDNQDDPSFGAERVFVEVSAGYSMPHFIRDVINHGYTGLEWFSRIPGTLGGWIYNNVHGHTLFIGDFIYSVRVLSEDNKVVEKSWKDLDFGYDYSIFHKNKEIVLSAKMRLFKGNVELAKNLVRDVIVKKNKYQPANSAGCVFLNISAEDQERLGFESNAVGYIVDKKFGWLGQQKTGGAWISEKHGNFIETDGTATAEDVLSVMEAIKSECKKQYDIDLTEEIFRVGEF
jgi:UDP-N-acetylmuramate dehydrogenase